MTCQVDTTVSSARRSKQLNLLIEQGSTFSIPIVYKENDLPVDLTGVTVRSHLREKTNSQTTVLELYSPGGGLTVTPLEGKIVMTIPANRFDGSKVWSGVWDMVILFPTGETFRILKGNWTLDRAVTRFIVEE